MSKITVIEDADDGAQYHDGALSWIVKSESGGEIAYIQPSGAIQGGIFVSLDGFHMETEDAAALIKTLIKAMMQGRRSRLENPTVSTKDLIVRSGVTMKDVGTKLSRTARVFAVKLEAPLNDSGDWGVRLCLARKHKPGEPIGVGEAELIAHMDLPPQHARALALALLETAAQASGGTKQ